MPTQPQAQISKSKPRLDKQKVKIALVLRGWTQAQLANRIGKSLTATNLAINHGTFPDITEAIRKELAL